MTYDSMVAQLRARMLHGLRLGAVVDHVVDLLAVHEDTRQGVKYTGRDEPLDDVWADQNVHDPLLTGSIYFGSSRHHT